MRKRKFVRLQLLALFAVLLLLLYRVVEGPPAPKGLVVFADLEPGRLQHRAFRLQAPDTLFVEATGSFEDAEGAAGLAAYGWILRRDDRSVVWRMDPKTAQRERGTLAAAADTLRLKDGTYDVYFASFGNRRGHERGGTLWDRFKGGSAWRNDGDKWRLVLRSLTGIEGRAEVLDHEDREHLAPQGELLVWTSAPMEGFQSADRLFDVQRPVKVRLYAVGEIDDTQMDYGWVENVLTGERVWEMTLDNTKPAGGWDVNRVFEGELALAPGIYRALYRTDARQSYEDWVANPPFDPAGWGLSVFADGPSARDAVSDFDPWQTRTPIVRFNQIGNRAIATAQLDVRRPVRLLAYAVGEIGSNPYDYAWIQNNATQQRVWEMTRDASQPAGGDDNNRIELAFVALEPGQYTLGYQTDDSHAYGDWRNGEPEHPDRWGVTLFPVATSFDPADVQVLSESRQQQSEAPETPETPESPEVPEGPPPPALGTGVDLLKAAPLGAEVKEEIPFELTGPTALHIYAMGEISLSGRYDYGWIENADNGEIVWEMTWQNTRPAGGDDRNRLFDGVVQFEPGRYVVHFHTDFSHNHGDFGERAPENAEAWGITIEKL